MERGRARKGCGVEETVGKKRWREWRKNEKVWKVTRIWDSVRTGVVGKLRRVRGVTKTARSEQGGVRRGRGSWGVVDRTEGKARGRDFWQQDYEAPETFFEAETNFFGLIHLLSPQFLSSGQSNYSSSRWKGRRKNGKWRGGTESARKMRESEKWRMWKKWKGKRSGECMIVEKNA